MGAMVDLEWSGGYSFSPFHFGKTEVEFEFSRRNASKGSNICAVYNPGLQETLINGVLQGRRQFDSRGASALCDARMCEMVHRISALLDAPWLQCIRHTVKYEQFKQCELLQARRKTKGDVTRLALNGWVRNDGDDFELPWK
jgi:tRNA-specific adenosine deaminase 1